MVSFILIILLIKWACEERQRFEPRPTHYFFQCNLPWLYMTSLVYSDYIILKLYSMYYIKAPTTIGLNLTSPFSFPNFFSFLINSPLVICPLSVNSFSSRYSSWNTRSYLLILCRSISIPWSNKSRTEPL